MKPGLRLIKTYPQFRKVVVRVEIDGVENENVLETLITPRVFYVRVTRSSTGAVLLTQPLSVQRSAIETFFLELTLPELRLMPGDELVVGLSAEKLASLAKITSLTHEAGFHPVELLFPVAERHLLDPWWLCASMYYQMEILFSLESIMYPSPIVWSYGYPLRVQPRRATVQFFAAAAFDAIQQRLQAANQQIQLLRTESVLYYQDFLTGAKHASVELSGMINHRRRDFLVEIDHSESSGPVVFENTLQERSSAGVAPEHRMFFITAVAGREKRLRRMIKLYANAANRGKTFGICLVGYEENTYNIQRLLWPIPPRIPTIVVERTGPFMKAPGLQDCIDRLEPNDIAFVLDVDIDFEPELIDLVRRTVLQGRRAVAPIVFYENYDEYGNVFTDSPHGYATMGTGIIGAYVSDIRRVGGFDIDTFRDAHGWEDTDFFFRLRHAGLSFLRFRENTLIHMAHPRTNDWSRKSLLRRSADVFGCEEPSTSTLRTARFGSARQALVSPTRFYLKSKLDSNYTVADIRGATLCQTPSRVPALCLDSSIDSSSTDRALPLDGLRRAGFEVLQQIPMSAQVVHVNVTLEADKDHWPEYIVSNFAGTFYKSFESECFHFVD